MPAWLPAHARIALLFVSLLHLVGCTTLVPVTIPDERAPDQVAHVRLGDDVELVTKAGTLERFEVTRLDASGLGGAEQFFLYEELTSLKVRRPDPRNDTWLNAGIAIAVIALLFAVADSSSVSGCSGDCN